MKSKNPFADCTCFNDVFQVIRKQCEEIRGAKYKVFKTYNYFIRNSEQEGPVLSFCIETNDTLLMEKERGWGKKSLNWFALVTGYENYLFPMNTRFGRYDGSAFAKRIFSGGSGGGNGKTVHMYATIRLKDLPKIKKLHERNLLRLANFKIMERANYPFTEADTKLREQMDALNKRVEDWRKENTERYVKAYPQYDLRTGKPE